MSDVEQLTAALAELKSQRDGLLSARTKESTAEAARTFLDGARARSSQGVGGLIVNGHAIGEPLDDVLRAFLLADPKLEAWLGEQAGQFAELTDKQRDSRLRKLGAEIKEAEGALREARKQAAIEEIEREFAPEAGERNGRRGLRSRFEHCPFLSWGELERRPYRPGRLLSRPGPVEAESGSAPSSTSHPRRPPRRAARVGAGFF